MKFCRLGECRRTKRTPASTDIGEIQVLRDQESGLRLRRFPYLSIATTCETFAGGCVYAVSEVFERGRRVQRKILVQFDLHRKSGTVGVGKSSSAEAAAKAIAA
jgi:hypothetical protein